ncbi:MAG: D-alanine--D-alanine ligase [Candidatus Omnitrophica bacterium]|nr:D-alanine--D-alanine ligase [Candidatus Omnitrophota bacterium]
MSSSGFGNIGVLMGGCSSEREISLRSGSAVAQALAAAGYAVQTIDITTNDRLKIIAMIKHRGIEAAFLALHGRLGEDGVIQSILEEIDIPYTGSGPAASQKAFNKVTAQTAFQNAGLAVPENFFITDGEEVSFKNVFGVLKRLPLVVKAACEGSSIGVYMVRHPSQWEATLKDALAFGSYVIVEKFIKGREVTAGIFDGEALPLVEIITQSPFFDFNAKYQKGLTDYVVPAPLPQELTQKIQSMALSAYDVLGCEGFARVDIRIDESGQPYILELNTIPGFTETSLFPKAAAKVGYSFLQVCEKLLDLAYGPSSLAK